MIGWEQFTGFGIAAILLWAAGSAATWKNKKIATLLFGGGIVIFTTFIVLYWISLGRAPMKSMGETRLWYSFFVSTTSWILFVRWKYLFLLPFGAILSTVFVIINITKPEIHTTMLMPALQSAWFIPHVTVYMLAYALVTVAQILALLAYFKKSEQEVMQQADNLVRIGSALILIGMLMGAVWAKQAWGNYWTWDAKENWAAVTWLLYVSYLHIRWRWRENRGWALIVLSLALLALQITWYGVNYLPAAQKSMHAYT
ncbi:MAG: cytochrome c biogenesis protein CcsA [Phocaeicola sp.]